MTDGMTANLTGQAIKLIRAAGRIIVFTGAGISTESGLPDFRSAGGIWDRFDPDDFTYDKFLSEPRTRRLWWNLIREGSLSTEVKPNAAHYAIAELHQQGKLAAVITQNIDNLHQTAGVPDEIVFELHGNLKRATCLRCGREYGYAEIRDEIERATDGPQCRDCGDVLKPNIVFFGEALPEEVFTAASRTAETADVCIVIGSTLIVYPAADIPLRALQAGARLIIINLSPTPLDHQADVVINARAGETMRRIMDNLAGN